MARANFLTVAQQFNLDRACSVVMDAYGPHIYLVGSVLHKRDYRDVDVRCVLDDATYDRLFPNAQIAYLVGVTIAEWLSRRTDLPVDFQFQRMTEANEEFDGMRSAIGMIFRRQPGDLGGEG